MTITWHAYAILGLMAFQFLLGWLVGRQGIVGLTKSISTDYMLIKSEIQAIKEKLFPVTPVTPSVP